MGPTTDGRLAGRVIWVTRPRQQSAALCRMIATAGGTAVRLPLIEIQPVPLTADAAAVQRDLAAADLIIFVSRNAVSHAKGVLADIYRRIKGKQLLAVGAGTREELARQGLTDVITAPSGMGSAALLHVEALRPERLAGKRVLIIRGIGGRDVLEHTLTGSGAVVHYLEVYRRALPGVAVAALAQHWRTNPPDAIIITSVEGLRNLVKMTATDQQGNLLRTPLAVMSERIAAVAREAGFTGATAVARDASDTGLLEATMKLYED